MFEIFSLQVYSTEATKQRWCVWLASLVKNHQQSQSRHTKNWCWSALRFWQALASRCLEAPLGRRQLCTPHEAQCRKMLTDVFLSSNLLWVPISCLFHLSAYCQACTGRNTKLIGVTVSLSSFAYLCRKFSSEFLSLQLLLICMDESRQRTGTDCKVTSFVGSSAPWI